MRRFVRTLIDSWPVLLLGACGAMVLVLLWAPWAVTRGPWRPDARLATARDSALVQASRAAADRARAETVYVRDTVRLTHAITRYRAARATLPASLPALVPSAGDTVRVDTLGAVRAMRAAIADADTALAACTAVVTSCAARIAAAESTAAAERRLAAATHAVTLADATARARAHGEAAGRRAVWRRVFVVTAVAIGAVALVSRRP